MFKNVDSQWHLHSLKRQLSTAGLIKNVFKIQLQAYFVHFMWNKVTTTAAAPNRNLFGPQISKPLTCKYCGIFYSWTKTLFRYYDMS